MNTIQPNYAVKALVPVPAPDNEQKEGLLKKTDIYISAVFKSRRKIYRLLLLIFCFFSVLGIYFYNYNSSGFTPLTSYTPVTDLTDITLLTVLSFRKYQIAISLFIFLCGFTIFGPAVSTLSISVDAFLIGFTLKFSLDYLTLHSFTAQIMLYLFLVAMFSITDIFIACEVIKYSKYAKTGLKELFHPKRFWIYTTSYIFLTGFTLLITYCFMSLIH